MGGYVFAFGWAAAMAVVLCLSWAAVSLAEEPAAQGPNPFEGRSDVVPEGQSLFNQYCSHCHGPNAVQGERPRDLRRLAIRYGQRAPEVFWQNVTKGRPDKGMPVWRGTLSDDVLWRIFTYLQSVQTPP